MPRFHWVPPLHMLVAINAITKALTTALTTALLLLWVLHGTTL